MPSWWGKSSSKDSKKKPGKEGFIDSLHRKFKIPSEIKPGSKSGGSRRRTIDTVSEMGCQSLAASRSPSPSKLVSRCQSFVDRPHPQPLPLPGLHRGGIGRTDSGISLPSKPRPEKGSKPLSFLPLPRPSCIRNKPDPADLDGDVINASFSSECSIDDSEDPTDSRQRSPLASDYENGSRTAVGSPSSMMARDQSFMELKSREAIKPANQVSALSHKRGLLNNHVPNLQVPSRSNFYSAPDSSLSSPSRSPMRAFGAEQVNSAFWTGKTYPDLTPLGSGQCSSPGSGQNSGHNSMGGDMSGQLFWQPSRGSPEYSPIPSPRKNSPGPSSRIHSGAVTPLHPRAGGPTTDDGKQQSHRLPLPPITISNSSPFSHSNSAATSPSVPRSPGRAENPTSPGSRWKKGKLLGRGTFGHVYLGFNSERGEMCAMKEVTLFSDDAKSKESAKQLGQEIALLSRLRHPNIVQYYGCEAVDDKLYIYLEYVSGGSIYKLLQEYGILGESAIRSYTKQILSGLAYLHAKNTVHRDIKGANILVDPNGRIKLADFGMAKHITGQSCPLSFKGSPYWMAPEVIKNSNGCNLAVDIWSLGCTVLEMATTKPPWSQFEGVAAMFKIGNSKDLPSIPDNLPDEGKDFVRLCLQRNPQHRPTAAQLLEHPFVKNAAPLERPIIGPELSDLPAGVSTGGKSLGIGHTRNILNSESERLAIHSSRVLKIGLHSSEIHIPRNISCPVSPIGSPLLYPRSPQHLNGRMSPSPISSPRTTSGSSTPLTGGGSGTIPFHQLNQSVFLQEDFGIKPKPPQSPYISSPSYHSPNHDIFRGVNSGSQIFIPDNLPDEGKDFVRLCLQRNPQDRPTAAQLLEHRFVKNAAPLERPIIGPELSDLPAGVSTGGKSLGIGHTRNILNSESERLAIHSSRVLKIGLHSSEIHIPRNISCPVSPIGSPLLYPRSPQHLNGRMSPSPISSPRTTSGSSTPLTGGGSGTIPFHQLNQSVFLQEEFGIKPKPPQSPYISSPSYHSPNHDIFRGVNSGSQIFRELLSGENDSFGKQFGRPNHGEPYDGQSVLADRVSQQLLRDNPKLSPSLDLSSCSPLPNRTNGI